DVLPTLWFRNTWSWANGGEKPALRQVAAGTVRASHTDVGGYTLHCDAEPELLFTENESNASRLWGQPNPSPYVKDAFHECVVAGKREAVNPTLTGTKAAAHYSLEVPAGDSRMVRLRLKRDTNAAAFADFDETFVRRLADADEFYD